MVRTIYNLNDAFGMTRDIPVRYVQRLGVDDEFADALSEDRHIVLHGSSKQGKTCLRKYHLRDREHLLVSCSNKWDLKQLNSAILKAAGYLVTSSVTESVSGQTKVSAQLEGSATFGFGKFGAKAGAEAGEGTEKSLESTPVELDATDVNDMIAALREAGAPNFLVLEDFHYLPEDTQTDFAVALKAFHEQSELVFIIIGVWHDAERLQQLNGDLVERVISINADLWEEDALLEVVEAGEDMMNVAFAPDFKADLIDSCYESVWVAKQACRKACKDASVSTTGEQTVEIAGDLTETIDSVIHKFRGRFEGFLTKFALGFQESELNMFRWLLYPVLTTDPVDLERGIPIGDLKITLNQVHPRAPINQGNLTNAIKSLISLQVTQMNHKPIVLDYDHTDRRLKVVDREFLIWLKHQDRDSLLRLVEICQ